MIDDNGNVVGVGGNKIGECTVLENIDEETYGGPTRNKLEEATEREEERQIAEKMGGICPQTLERVQSVYKQINVEPQIEEAGCILQECNGSLRALWLRRTAERRFVRRLAQDHEVWKY
jgi:hypothetical protein